VGFSDQNSRIQDIRPWGRYFHALD